MTLLVFAAGMVAFFTINTVTVAFASDPVRRPRERCADVEYWPFLHELETT